MEASDPQDADLLCCQDCKMSFVVMAASGEGPPKEPIPKHCPYCGSTSIIPDEILTDIYVTLEGPKN